MEIWKDVVGLEGLYKVSNKGRVKTMNRFSKNGVKNKETKERILKGNTSGHRYPRYNLLSNITYIHHIVAEAFLGKRPEGMNVLHKDDNPLNNCVENLYYGSQTNNAEDGIRNGGWVTGEDVNYAKLTEVQVCNIYTSPFSRHTLSEQYNISLATIRRIRMEQTWRYLFFQQEEFSC